MSTKENIMTDLEELVACAERLCSRLEIAAQDEKLFCDDMCLQLERYSWEVYRMANSIKEIQIECGV